MGKLVVALLLFSTTVFGGFFADEVYIHKDDGGCQKSLERFTVALEAALRAPISQVTTRPIYDTACAVGFTYYAAEQIQIEKGFWPSGLSGGLCPEFRKIAERRYLDTHTIPLLATACSGSTFHYAYVNHQKHVSAMREEVFLVNPEHRWIDAEKLARLLSEAGADKIELFKAGEQYGFAYRIDKNLKRLTVDWDLQVMPFVDNGYVYQDQAKAEVACKTEREHASQLASEMTEIGTHYECFIGKGPSMKIGMSPWQLKGGKLPKNNKAHPGWWQDWVPLAGFERDLLKCQERREHAMQDYAKFTGKKPLYALCVERENEHRLSYWVVGK